MNEGWRALRTAVRPAAVTIAMVGGAALVAHFGQAWLDPPSLALFFVAPIVLAAIRDGLWAALSASLLSVVAINYLFVEPRYTLAVAREQDLGALVLLAAVGGLVSVIAQRARALDAARLEASRERFKSELLAGVSHDLRTPLSTILFTLQSLQRFSAHSPAAREELLNLAEREARRLAALVDALLTAARMEAGASAVRIEAVNVGDIVASALADAERETAGLVLETHVPDDLPLAAADPALAARALWNVVVNAAKYGAGGPISVRARREHHTLVVEVADRGPGLGEHPEQLFEKFVRGVSGDGRPAGLGLGLSVARDFMRSQGGGLIAANREGGGAVFTLTLRSWTKAVRDGG